MRPTQCPNCASHDFYELPDAYVCSYCDTRFPRETADPPADYVAPPPIQIQVNHVYGQTPPVSVRSNMKNKWVAFFLCFFFGMLGAHKFYEGKIFSGILYLFTGGICGLGWLFDMLALLCKPNPYYP